MTDKTNPRTEEDFAALPYGTVCLDKDGAAWMRVERYAAIEDEWQPHDEYEYTKCNDSDMAFTAETCETRVVFLPPAKSEV